MTRLFGSQRGTSTLEFAAVLPALLMVMMLSVELSRAWLTLNVVTTAAREGARAASVVAAADVASAGQARVDEVLLAANLECTAQCSVTCVAGCAAPNDQIEVDVAVEFRTIVPVFIPLLQSVTITQVASIRYEGP